MASNQHRSPLQEQGTSATTSGSGSDSDAARYEVPLYESDESASSQEQAITVSGLEYAVFMKGYRLIEKNYGQLPEYRGICERFEDQARMAPTNHGRITWTSFFQPGLECSYLDALHEMTHLLATMMLNTREDKDAMRDIVRLANDVVNHRRTFDTHDDSHRLIIRKWEHLRDTLQGTC